MALLRHYQRTGALTDRGSQDRDWRLYASDRIISIVVRRKPWPKRTTLQDNQVVGVVDVTGQIEWVGETLQKMQDRCIIAPLIHP